MIINEKINETERYKIHHNINRLLNLLTLDQLNLFNIWLIDVVDFNNMKNRDNQYRKRNMILKNIRKEIA